MVVGSKGGAGAAVSVQARSANKQKTPAAVAFASTTGNPSFLHRPAVADGHFWQRLSVRLRQKAVRRAYLNSTVQWCIAILIGGNFVSNVIEKEVDPRGDIYPQLWYLVEMTWNVLFIIELLWNMYGCFYVTRWKNHFFNSSWNLFDFTVVAVSIPSMTGADLGFLGKLRMLRAFRVFRLFKRIKSLNAIIVSLSRAVPGIVNAGIVMVLVMCIYAILGVDLFLDFGEGGSYVNIEGEQVALTTARGMNYNAEYYGKFSRSLYTLFQVLTGESWSEAVARPAVFARESWIRGVLFYVSYIVICGIVLINVAVAVLLEKMVDQEHLDQAEELQNMHDPNDGTALEGNGGEHEPASARLLDGVAAASTKGGVAAPSRSSSAAMSAQRDAAIVALQQDVQALRDEMTARDQRLGETLATLLAKLEQQSLTLSKQAELQQALHESSGSRRRHHKPRHREEDEASIARRHANHGALPNTNGGATTQSPEDRAQDGDRGVSKAKAGRVSHEARHTASRRTTSAVSPSSFAA